jgi:AcrR family transcriptional regulator
VSPRTATRADTRERILEGAYACVARYGLSKTTIEDAARQAGVSRATVYRHFPNGRDELIGAVVAWEQLRFFTRLYEEVRDATSLEEVLERGLRFARRALLEHVVLAKVLETEPEVLLPKLTVDAERIVGLVAGFLEPYVLAHPRRAGIEVSEAAEYLARMVVSLIASPGRFELEDPDQLASVVRTELLAGIVPEQGRA